MGFKKKKNKEEETATTVKKEVVNQEAVREEKPKLLVEMTEPERFVLIYNELLKTNDLLEELIKVAKEE